MLMVPAPTKEIERVPELLVTPPSKLRVAPEAAERTEEPPPEVTVTVPLIVLLPETEATLP